MPDDIRIPILYGFESDFKKFRLNETKSDTPFFDNIAISSWKHYFGLGLFYRGTGVKITADPIKLADSIARGDNPAFDASFETKFNINDRVGIVFSAAHETNIHNGSFDKDIQYTAEKTDRKVINNKHQLLPATNLSTFETHQYYTNQMKNYIEVGTDIQLNKPTHKNKEKHLLTASVFGGEAKENKTVEDSKGNIVSKDSTKYPIGGCRLGYKYELPNTTAHANISYDILGKNFGVQFGISTELTDKEIKTKHRKKIKVKPSDGFKFNANLGYDIKSKNDYQIHTPIMGLSADYFYKGINVGADINVGPLLSEKIDNFNNSKGGGGAKIHAGYGLDLNKRTKISGQIFREWNADPHITSTNNNTACPESIGTKNTGVELGLNTTVYQDNGYRVGLTANATYQSVELKEFKDKDETINNSSELLIGGGIEIEKDNFKLSAGINKDALNKNNLTGGIKLSYSF